MLERQLIKLTGFSILIICAGTGAAVAGDAFDIESQIIAEPENDSGQVRGCEAAGPGFKYIPGTQTCLRISGHVRYEININGRDD